MSDADPLEQALDSVADRTEADWDRLASVGDPSLSGQLRGLYLVYQLARAQHKQLEIGPVFPAVPFKWGGFEIRDLIARGAHGAVYRAWDARLEREVALKLLNASGRDEAVLREGRLLARVRHPNVISVYGADRIDGAAGLWMEFVRGRTLRQLIDEAGPLPCAEAARIGAEICGAVQALHAVGLVHRDVNARNVMRDESGRTIVMDLGAAEDSAGDADVVEGTPLYLAPELLHGSRPSPSTDIYAIGVVLYFLVTGTFPLPGRTVAELRDRFRETGITELTPRPGVDARFCGVVNRALAAREHDRFPTAADMEAALQAPPARAGALLATMAILVAAVIIGAFLRRTAASATVHITSETRLTNDAMLEIDPDLSPDGRVLTYSAGPPGHMRIMLKPLSGEAPGYLTAAALGDERRPRWSPDGRSIVFTCGRMIEIAQLDTRHVASFDGGAFIRSAVWSRAGDILFVGDDTLYRLQPATRAVTRLRQLEFESGGLSLAPDGRRMAYSTGNAEFVSGTTQFGNTGGSNIRVAALDASPSYAVTDDAHLNISPAWSDDGARLYFVSDRDGQRDLYSVAFDAQGRAGTPVRLTTGLDAFTADVSETKAMLVYSTLRRPANLWMLPLQPDRVSTFADMTRLTSGNETVEEGALSSDGQFVFYDSTVDGTARVYRVSRPDGVPQPLTPANVESFFNDISPDGSQLAYHTFRNGQRDVFVIAPGSTGAVHVTSGLAAQWSPDGRRLLVAVAHGVRGREGRHVIAERDATGAWAVTGVVTHGYCQDLMHWREDGSGFIAVCDGGIRQLSLEGRVLSTIYEPHDPTDPVPEFCSAPHHGIIMFKAYQGSAGTFWSLPATGGTPRLRARVSDPDRVSSRVEFTGDDARVVFAVDDPQADIWMARLGR